MLNFRIMNVLKSINKKIALTPMAIMFSMFAWAQGGAADNSLMWLALLGFVFVVALLVLVVAVYLLQLLKSIVRNEEMEKAKAEGKEYVEAPGFWSQFDKEVLTQAVAIEEEETITLDHDYDGIRELDNHLPPWWKYLFYLTIAFSVVYLLVYHVFSSMPLQEQEYELAMAKAEAAKVANVSADDAGIDETNVVLSTDETILANGQKVFVMNCAPCHKENGAGGIGPNLTDEYWLNGGGVSNIFKAVKYGFPDKGMISWEPLLSSQEMSDVSSYVVSLQGSNPPNAKAPQGELYVPEEVTVEEPAAEQDSVVVEE